MKKFIGSLCLILCMAPLSACADQSDPEAGPSTSPGSSQTPSPTTTPTPTPTPVAVTVRDAPRGLAGVVNRFYNHAELGTAIDPRVGRLVQDRQPASRPVSGSGHTGNWKGRPVAVVTVGDDVTLAVNHRGWTIVGGWWPSLGVDEPVLGGVRRVLALGGDAREDVRGGTSSHGHSAGTEVDRSRADSIHIIGFDGRGGAGMLGLTRDYLARPSVGGPLNKINVAMQVGGPKVQQDTITEFTGVPLEGYFLTGFNQFTAMIDAFGPLKIFLQKRTFISPRVGHVPGGGEVELNGYYALHLARARKHVKGGDLGRSHQQGRIMLAAAAMAKALGPQALPRFMTEASPHLWTNLSPRQVLTFLAHIYTLDPKSVPNKVAGGRAGRAPNGAQVRIPGDKAKGLFEDIKDGNLTG